MVSPSTNEVVDDVFPETWTVSDPPGVGSVGARTTAETPASLLLDLQTVKSTAAAVLRSSVAFASAFIVALVSVVVCKRQGGVLFLTNLFKILSGKPFVFFFFPLFFYGFGHRGRISPKKVRYIG
jgi:hypothetical protein